MPKHPSILPCTISFYPTRYAHTPTSDVFQYSPTSAVALLFLLKTRNRNDGETLAGFQILSTAIPFNTIASCAPGAPVLLPTWHAQPASSTTTSLSTTFAGSLPVASFRTQSDVSVEHGSPAASSMQRRDSQRSKKHWKAFSVGKMELVGQMNREAVDRRVRGPSRVLGGLKEVLELD
uniref:Uncharacterized protein n=1 Tax=Moniliophthora roreri TaxID=221103 RepID=A0A0W0G520_MONRR